MVKKVDTQLKRPPVVTVMGHVDHGKTSLLDSIRGSFVANKEVGGITQNITAFDVVHDSRHITFIDTPGHELFSNMRQSGVLMTDIVLLIIAVDDGIMPQTKEVIEIIKENNLNVIVVFNKIDLPSNNLAKIKSDLGREGIFLEEFGGKVLSVEVSAKTKKGVNDLLDLILLQYDMLDNIYTPSERNSLVVLESFKDPHVGNISLCIVEDGTLSQGDNIFSLKRGELGKVRSIKNDKSESLKEAGVSTPVYIFGQSLFLDVGEKIVFSKDKIKLDINKEKLDLGKFEEEDRDSFLFPKEEVKMLSIILKADTKGSLDAIVTALEKIELEEIKIKIFKKDLED